MARDMVQVSRAPWSSPPAARSAARGCRFRSTAGQALAPPVRDLPTGLPPGPPRVQLACTLALLPGTMSVRLEGDRLRVHVLDARLPVEAEVHAARFSIAALGKTGAPFTAGRPRRTPTRVRHR